MKERVGIYNRCSTEEEVQINALNIQAAESREIAVNKGWIIADQYIESESGTTNKRSEYQRLLDDISNNKFDIIMIKSIDRLMRSTKDWYLFLDKITQHHIKLYIYIDNKFYSPDDSLITGIKAMLAEEFSRELSKKIKNAHKRRQAKKSGLNITRPMFGWDKVSKDEYVINEEEAKHYRTAFTMAKEGKGFYSIAKYMDRIGVRGKDGKRISDVQWRNMVYSPRAHGTVVLHKREYDFERKKYVNVPKEEWIYVEDALPAIVSYEYQKEVLEKVLERTIEHSFKDYQRNMSNVGLYALSGKLYCGECGLVYYRTSFVSGKQKIIEWKCSKALAEGRRMEEKEKGCNNINVIEKEIFELIENACKAHYEVMFGAEETILDEAIAAIRKVIRNDNGEKELKKLVKELNKQKQKKKVLFHKLMDEVISDNDFKTFNEGLDGKIKCLEERIEGINKRCNEYNEYEKRMSEIKSVLKKGDVINKAKMKELIDRIDKILVHSDNTLEIIFDKVKLLSLLRIYNCNIAESSLDEKFFKIKIPYVHKTPRIRKREDINEQIISIFKENAYFMLKDIPPIVGMSESYVNTSIRMLKDANRLRYERGKPVGKWIVTE